MRHYDTTDADLSPNLEATIPLTRLNAAVAPANAAALALPISPPITFNRIWACTIQPKIVLLFSHTEIVNIHLRMCPNSTVSKIHHLQNI